MDREAFEFHLTTPVGRGFEPPAAHSGAAGGAICGDLVTIRIAVSGDRVRGAGFDAEGCGALTAAASAAIELIDGAPVLDAALVGVHTIADALGGLSAGKIHAAELVSDALHSALGAAVAADAQLTACADRTLVAMSGGVDSAVAALLVSDAGREAVAVTLELWRDPENDAEASCCSASAVRLARSVAHGMGLPHLTLDLRDAFRAGVVDPWLDGHRAGETPNPCVGCNGHVRIDAMIELADRLGAADLATGHYARLTGDGLLRAAVDDAKDQTYMLSALAPASIARLRFPLGELTKPQVRELAIAHGISVARRKESQDLCFLAGTGKRAFLARHGRLEDAPGEIVDADGNVLGTHTGVHGFTVGQRRGLKVGGGDILYVLRTEPSTATVVAGPRAALEIDSVAVRGARLHAPAARIDRVKLRYRSKPLACRVAGDHGPGHHRRLTLELAAPADGGAARGQIACLLDGDVVVGWATIA